MLAEQYHLENIAEITLLAVTRPLLQRGNFRLQSAEAAPSPVQFNALERRYGNTLALLNFGSLCDFQRVVHLNAEITHSALHF